MTQLIGPGSETEAKGVVFNTMRFAVNDGAGIRTTVFLKGCPLDCWWCHNPESQAPTPELIRWPERCISCGRCASACPSGRPGARESCTACGRCVDVCPAGAREIAGRVMTARQVLREAARDRVFYDQSGGGVTFSGGEPLAQSGFLLELLKLCRAEGIPSAVDTCGYAPEADLLAVAAWADAFLYDIKHMDTELHRRYTGAGNELILRNLVALSKVHPAVVARMPVIPGINDGPGHARLVAAFLTGETAVRRVTLLPYHASGEGKYVRLGRGYRMAGTASPPQDRLLELAEIFTAAGLEPSIGG